MQFEVGKIVHLVFSKKRFALTFARQILYFFTFGNIEKIKWKIELYKLLTINFLSNSEFTIINS